MIRPASLLLLVLTGTLHAQIGKLDPQIQKIVGEISSDRIAADLKALTGFETRGNFSDPNQPNRGIGAARKWIFDQFKSYSPRLQVTLDPWKVKKQGTRILRDVDVVNVVAVLPGTTHPEQRIIVSGHYDSLNIVPKANLPPLAPGIFERGVDSSIDFEKSVEAPAPGASDDASGTAVVLELARVMSQYRFKKTIVFIAFAGEEIGLVGSTLYADRAKANNEQIAAVFNNDVVGNDLAGNGHAENGRVHVFSEGPEDSPSRALARYIRDTASRYVPSFQADPVFRYDRFARGGDHTPFNLNGFTAVRFTTAAENLGAQHTAEDTLDKTAPWYTASVARVNGASIANLALAPAMPDPRREITEGPNKGRKTVDIQRGKSRYDAVLRWHEATKDAKPDGDLAGYAIVTRSTTAPFWEQQVFVGNVHEYTLYNVGIDDVIFGVKAIDQQGHESPVAAWSNPAPAKAKIELRN